MADTSKTIDIVVELRNKTTKALKEIETNVKAVPKATGGILTALQRIAIGSAAVLGTISRLVFSFKGLLAAGGIALTAKSFLDVASSFEQMELKLNAITKGGGRQTLEALSDLAMELPVSLQQLVDAFTMLQSQGLKPTEDKLKTLVNVGQVLGEQTMPLIADSLSLMASRGEITELALTSLTKANINVGQYLQDAFGMGVEELKKSSHSIEEIINAIWKGLDAEFSPYAKAAGNSWGDLWQLFINHVKRAQGQLMRAGIFDELKKGVASLTQEFDKWWAANQKLIIQNIPVYIEKVKAGVGKLFDSMDKFYKFFKSLPDDIVGIAGAGILGRILWGGPKGFLLAAAAVGLKIADLINTASEGVTDLEGLKKHWQTLADEAQISIEGISPVSKIEALIKNYQEDIKRMQLSATPEIFKTEYIENAEFAIEKLKKDLIDLYQAGGERTILSKKDFEMLQGYRAQLKQALDTLRELKGGAPSAKPGEEPNEPTGKTGFPVLPKVDKPGLEKPTTQMMLQAQLDLLKNAHAVELDELDYRYDQGILKSKEYYDQKKALLEKNLIEETQLLQAIKASEKEPIRKFTVDQTIIKTTQDNYNQLTQLERQYREGSLAEMEEAAEKELEILRSSSEEQSATLEFLYRNNLVSLQDYYNEKVNIIKTATDQEIKILDDLAKKAESEGNLKKRDDINKEIVQKALETSNELIRIAQEEAEAIKAKAQEINAARLGMWGDIRSAEGLNFKDTGDTLLKDLEINLAQQLAAQEQYFNSVEEKNRWLAAKQKELLDEYLSATSIGYNTLMEVATYSAQAIGQAFSTYFFDLMQGKWDSFREIAYNTLVALQRIVANALGQIVTQWLVQQAQEFIKNNAITEGLKNKAAQLLREAAANQIVSASITAQIAPVLALAAAYKALATAKALAKIAGGGMGDGGAIDPPMMAGGGAIPGTSPHPKADNIPIWATAGEYMQPVKAVQHYGKAVMEGIRSLAYPKEMFSLEPVESKVFQQDNQLVESFKNIKNTTKDILQKTAEVFTTRDLTKELVEKTTLPIKSLKPNIVKHLYNFLGIQKKSGGGTIEGHSPTATSDNIPIMATAGEFMHPVKAVQYYGKEVMEGIRQRAIPKEVFSALRFPNINIPTPKMSYAMGGEVAGAVSSSSSSEDSGGKRDKELSIVNIVDPALVGQFLSSPDGEDAIVNVISNRSYAVKRSLGL